MVDKGRVVFIDQHGEQKTRSVDLIIGADGVYSKMRSIIQRNKRINFSQQYIDHGWIELSIPPDATGKAQMDTRHLHIWPRQTFMMIALPNRDNSFTGTPRYTVSLLIQ